MIEWFVSSWRGNPELALFTPVLGYTVPYALANILFTMWGSFMVLLRSQFG